MNYFDMMHTGDIIVSNTGNIGYVTNINRDDRVFNWCKIYDSRGDRVPVLVKDVSANAVPRFFKRVGCNDIYTNSCTCNNSQDKIEDSLDDLNNNLLTLIDKLDEIIKGC